MLLLSSFIKPIIVYTQSQMSQFNIYEVMLSTSVDYETLYDDNGTTQYKIPIVEEKKEEIIKLVKILETNKISTRKTNNFLYVSVLPQGAIKEESKVENKQINNVYKRISDRLNLFGNFEIFRSDNFITIKNGVTDVKLTIFENGFISMFISHTEAHLYSNRFENYVILDSFLNKYLDKICVFIIFAGKNVFMNMNEDIIIKQQK